MTDTITGGRRPHLVIHPACEIDPTTEPAPPAPAVGVLPWSILHSEADGSCAQPGLDLETGGPACEVGPYGPWDLFVMWAGGHRWWTDRHILLRQDVLYPADEADPAGAVLAELNLGAADPAGYMSVTLPEYGPTGVKVLPEPSLHALLPVLSPTLNAKFEPKDPDAVSEASFWGRYAGPLAMAGLLLDPVVADDYLDTGAKYHFIWAGTQIVGCLMPLVHPAANGARQVTPATLAAFDALQAFALPAPIRWDVATACAAAVTKHHTDQAAAAAAQPVEHDHDLTPPETEAMRDHTGDVVATYPTAATTDEAGDL